MPNKRKLVRSKIRPNKNQNNGILNGNLKSFSSVSSSYIFIMTNTKRMDTQMPYPNV
jgi:hypothetical protein